jgi:hypothetical protein
MQTPAAAGANPHAQHGTAVGGTSSVAAVSRPGAETQHVDPAATLQLDPFDAPAPVSVSEAVKAAQSGGQVGHQARGSTQGGDRDLAIYACDAPRGDERRARPLSEVRHGAGEEKLT